MLQLSFIRDNRDETVSGLKRRNFKDAEEVIGQIIDLDTRRRETQVQLDDSLAQSNTLSKQIGQLMKGGEKDKAEVIKAQTSDLKEKGKELSSALEAVEKELNDLLLTVPNLPHASVPAGRSAEDNETIFEHGDKPVLHEGAKPHWELIADYGIIDFELGNKISGAGFPVYRGKGARLQRALINFFLDEAREAGYEEVMPPILVNSASGYGTGQLPDKEGQMYHMPEDDLYAIPTAEVPITNLYRDVILEEKELPVMNAGHTPCFRREAGSWGAHVRGLNRLHQFDKVEVVQVTHPGKSYEVLEQMVEHVKGLMYKLGLPFRILRLCGGDMGFTSALTYDFEVWSGGQGRWLEVSSVSNFETYQANRLKLRYKPRHGGKPELAHTLNGSALALPRIVAALLENNQTPDTIEMPEVLRSYCGFDRI